MVRFILFLSLLLLFYISWPVIEKKVENTGFKVKLEQLQSDMKAIMKDRDVLTTISNDFERLIETYDIRKNKSALTAEQIGREEREKVELVIPSEQQISINNIELWESKVKIEQKFGIPKRSSINEYGLNWNTYHDDYHNFFMVMFDSNNQVAGLYTNQDLIASRKGFKFGSSKEEIRHLFGEPIKGIQKGLVIYQFQEKSDHDVFLLDNTYATIFYDKHKGDRVTAIHIVRHDIEQQKVDFYTKGNESLREGLEYQLFDLTNSSRVEHQLPILNWDDHVKETARKHSMDMAKNTYFDHTNLEGQSPFDRLKEDHVVFHTAGENLAYGQFSSIFAHEGLMNSLGHRENILHNGFEYLGVGVAFNNESLPYYTQNYYAK